MLAFYGEPGRDLVGLAFKPRPFCRLGVVAASDGHGFSAIGDKDVALGHVAVTAYPDFSSRFGDCGKHWGLPRWDS